MKGRFKARLKTFLALALLTLALWGLYNAIVRATGLDSFWGMVLQIVLFAVIGAAIGVAVARRSQRKSS